jgi:RNA polymerase sigma-70 factor (ECF subfamily)
VEARRWAAHAAICALEEKPSLVRMWVTWLATVGRLRYSRRAIAVSRESLRLALIASFQYLPPRQRAVLLPRDVLAFPAADMLGMTTTAVKSALQRARRRLEEVAPAADLRS